VAKKRVAFLLCLVGIACLGGALARQTFYQHVLIDGRAHYFLGDDAMISMRYAYNLANGRGFLWNPGEYVQGYTNLGWTLIMAAVHWLGAPLHVAPLVVLLIDVVVYVALVAILVLRLRPIPGVVAGCLVALDGSLLAWTIAGFEATLQAVFITLAVLPFIDGRSSRWTPIWAALAFVVRPDAVIVFAWVALLMVWRREFRWTLAAGPGLVAAVLVFQRAYYGGWLPNTFYLKAGAGSGAWAPGLAYLGRFALSDFFSLPLLLAPLVLAAMRRELAVVCALPVAWSLYVVSVGGDAFEHGRFFVPIIPVLAVIAGLLVERLWALARNQLVTRVALVVAMMALGLHVALAVPLLMTTKPAQDASGMASTLGMIPRDSLVAVFAAGIVPYYLPEHRFHDLLGKSEVRIARGPVRIGPPGHNKWDYAYSLDVIRPDFIIGYGDFNKHGEGFYPALWRDERFRRDYQRVAVSPDNVIWIYSRRE